MKRIYSRRQQAIDPAHMIVLHHESIEQLELMQTAVEASEQTNDGMRDTLTAMADTHWEAYMDVIHMLTMHDSDLAAVMKKHGFAVRDSDLEDVERQNYVCRASLLALITALIRRHQRFVYFYGLRSNLMGDYLKESIAVEREHLAELIIMIQTLL